MIAIDTPMKLFFVAPATFDEDRLSMKTQGTL